jgi:predicted phosphodiesterase
MKIGVLSDTHDKLANIRRAEDRFAGRGADFCDFHDGAAAVDP